MYNVNKSVMLNLSNYYNVSWVIFISCTFEYIIIITQYLTGDCFPCAEKERSSFVFQNINLGLWKKEQMKREYKKGKVGGGNKYILSIIFICIWKILCNKLRILF